MTRTALSCCWWLLVGLVAWATDYVDVVKTKDGSVYRGVVVENRINEYVMVELAGGSRFRLNYADIVTMEREEVPDSASTDVPVRFTAQQGLFSVPYYTYRGIQYPRSRWGAGYLDLVDAILSTEQVSPQLADMVGGYRKSIRSAQVLYWGGFGIELVGVAWTFAVVGQRLVDPSPLDSSAYLRSLAGPYALVIGGLLVNTIGVLISMKEPVALVNAFNTSRR